MLIMLKQIVILYSCFLVELIILRRNIIVRFLCSESFVFHCLYNCEGMYMLICKYVCMHFGLE